MSRPPRLDDLVDDLTPRERQRLQRVHDLLLEAGPPPELSPKLARPPGREPLADVRVLPRGIPRRRLAASLVLAAAIASSAFGVGYLVGDGGDSGGTGEAFVSERNVTLQATSSAPRAAAVVRIGARKDGNLPMLVTVEGLDRLPLGDYYILYMTENGKPRVSCGTFNVPGGNEKAQVEFTVGYGLAGFDGFALVLYRLEGHKERTLLSGKLT